MNRSQRKRYIIAVYLGIGALAVTLAVVGATYAQGTVRDFALNLASDVLGVALLFFVVNLFFGLDPESATSQRIQNLITEIQRRYSVLIGPKEARSQFVIGDIISSAKHVDAIAYSLTRFLDDFRGPIIERVRAGANVRILIIDHKSMAGKLILDNANPDIKPAIFTQDMRKSLTHIMEITKFLENGPAQPKGSFEVRLLNWVPSCILIAIHPESESPKMKVSVNPPYYQTARFEDKLNIVFSRDEQPRWFDYFSRQFGMLWNQGYEWDGVYPTGDSEFASL